MLEDGENDDARDGGVESEGEVRPRDGEEGGRAKEHGDVAQ